VKLPKITLIVQTPIEALMASPRHARHAHDGSVALRGWNSLDSKSAVSKNCHFHLTVNIFNTQFGA
jgi:hypothetical protein